MAASTAALRAILVTTALSAATPSLHALGTRSHSGGDIPAFARKYGTSCLTCHVMPPRLNAFGESFRLNGYQMPRRDVELVRDSALPMGAPEWRDLFPDAVWPSSIPGSPPLALRLVADYETRANAFSSFVVPAAIELISAGTFGQDIGFFLSVFWAQGSGALISQTLLKFQNVFQFAGVPDRALNVWLGKFDQNYLPSYRALDRVYRNDPLWGSRRLSDLRIDSAGVNRTSATLFRPLDRQPGVELNGILARRFGYAAGVVQGVEAARDVDTHKDVYYAVRAKIGGRALDGSLATEVEHDREAWVDNALYVEHFGYFGRQAGDAMRRYGAAARATYGHLDAAAGYVWGEHRRPWASAGRADVRSWFARADYTLFPWLMGSLRVEDLEIVPTLPAGWRVTPGGQQDLRTVSPAMIILLRTNLRLTFEGEIYSRDASVADSLRRHAAALRLDVAF